MQEKGTYLLGLVVELDGGAAHGVVGIVRVLVAHTPQCAAHAQTTQFKKCK